MIFSAPDLNCFTFERFVFRKLQLFFVQSFRVFSLTILAKTVADFLIPIWKCSSSAAFVFFVATEVVVECDSARRSVAVVLFVECTRLDRDPDVLSTLVSDLVLAPPLALPPRLSAEDNKICILIVIWAHSLPSRLLVPCVGQ
jgi:hypothetical protein